MEKTGEREALKRALAPEPLPEGLKQRLMATPRRSSLLPWAVAAAAVVALAVQSWRIDERPAILQPPALEPDLAESHDIVLEVLRDEAAGLDPLLAGLPADQRERVRTLVDGALADLSGSLKDRLLSDRPSEDLLASLNALNLDEPLRRTRRHAALAWSDVVVSELGILGLDEAQRTAIRAALAAGAEQRNDVLVLPGLIDEVSYAVLTGLSARIEPALRENQKSTFQSIVNDARAELKRKGRGI